MANTLPTSQAVAPALRSLLAGIVDYAGMFPPAGLSLKEAATNYDTYQDSPDRWMLSRFVLSSKDLAALPGALLFPVSVLADPSFVWSDPRVKSIETKEVFRPGLPTYVEIPLEDFAALESVRDAGLFAKIRTGGLTPAAIPPAEAIAAFLVAAARLGVPFKATAGLHHPIRAVHPLTYAADAPTAVMHGFLNVFIAACLAWDHAAEETVLAVLNEEDPAAFTADTSLRWRDQSVPAFLVENARRDFAHSFGSCSFTEPVNELKELNWLPS